MKNVIPPITAYIGRYWQQPKIENILIDDTHAVMIRSDFEKLTDYSCSIPSGVYPGKMWKAITSNGTPFLRWFGIIQGRDDVCSNNQREIIIVEATDSAGGNDTE